MLLKAGDALPRDAGKDRQLVLRHFGRQAVQAQAQPERSARPRPRRVQTHRPPLPVAQLRLGHDAGGAGELDGAGVEQGASGLAGDPQPSADLLEGPSLLAELRHELPPLIVRGTAHGC
jgi:hypothetical protein